MKTFFILIIIILVALGGYYLFVRSSQNGGGGIDAITVTPVSHATAVLGWDETTIYMDPVGGTPAFANMPAPDLIFITDIHGDHLNIETLSGVITPDTAIVAPQAVADQLPEAILAQTTVLSNGGMTEQKGFSIEAIPMYNLPENPESFHTKGRGNGYIVERDGVRVYIAGDTADIPEMRALSNIDIAFVPMNLPYTMTVEQAANGVLAFAPARVYPYHYRGQDGLSDIGRFKELVDAGNRNIDVVLLDWYPQAQSSRPDGQPDVLVNMTGKSFEFSVKEIKVKVGQTVRVNFTSENGLHDWKVDEFEAATDRVNTGETTTVTFTADKVGEFEYYCSVGNHRAMGMVGKLIVEAGQ